MKTIEKLNELVINQLEQGIIPWRKPWGSYGSGRNYLSKKEYRGINRLMTNLAGYSCPYFLTFLQAKNEGFNIKKGEKGTKICYCGKAKDKKSEEEDKFYTFLKLSTVFNLEQTEQYSEIDWEKDFPDVKTHEHDPIAVAETFLHNYGQLPKIKESQKCSYNFHWDEINMPKIEMFDDKREYYVSFFHEIIHSTGHDSRLKRGFSGPQTTASYGKEELIAEIGANMLLNTLGVTRELDNSASYIASWIRAIKGNKNLLIGACSAAEKANEYINTHTHEARWLH